MSDEVKVQLADAASHTNRAYMMVRRSRQPDDTELNKTGVTLENKSLVTKTSSHFGGLNMASNEVMLMKPIMRFLQLLCENHNHDLQVSDVFLRVVGACGLK